MSMVVAADDETIVLAKEGDLGAWRALYTAHAGRLLVWLRSLPTGDPGVSAEDLAAETWLTAASRIADFRGSAQDFAGWLFGIARHLVWNQRRRSGRRGTVPYAVDLAEPGMWGTSDDVAAVNAVGVDLTRRLLALLPAREAEVVACLDVVGLDVGSVAAALGISRTAVRVAHHRGLTRLRKLIPTPGPVPAETGTIAETSI
jgi:RNA polymerase sigma-70 factor (ECF subfamily)